MCENIDLFEKIDTLPEWVQEIINKYSENDAMTSKELDKFQDELWELWYTFDYGLDMIPFELRELTMLDKAMEKITVEMVKNMDYGEEIELNEEYTLYHYMEDDLVVLNETEEWEEKYTVLYDDEKNTVHFEWI